MRFLGIKIVLIIGLVLGSHVWFESWKSGLVDSALLEQAQKTHAEELAILDKEINLANLTANKMKQEVIWARDYVAKQTAKTEKLRGAAKNEVQECLDLYIDSGFVH